MVGRDIDLYTHILDIVQVFEYEELDEVILVGHSWALREEGTEWLVVPYEPEVWVVTDPVDLRWMISRLSPMPWHTHDQPIRLTNPKTINIPRSYISCIDYDNFHFMAQRAKSAGWDYHELKTGHDAMITVPDKLVQILESLVQ